MNIQKYIYNSSLFFFFFFGGGVRVDVNEELKLLWKFKIKRIGGRVGGGGMSG